MHWSWDSNVTWHQDKTEGELASDTSNAGRDYLIQESATPRLSCFAREAWRELENKPKKGTAEQKAPYAAIQMEKVEKIYFPPSKTTILCLHQEAAKQMLDQPSLKSLSS